MKLSLSRIFDNNNIYETVKDLTQRRSEIHSQLNLIDDKAITKMLTKELMVVGKVLSAIYEEHGQDFFEDDPHVKLTLSPRQALLMQEATMVASVESKTDERTKEYIEMSVFLQYQRDKQLSQT